MKKKIIEQGDKVKDTVTGFTGIVNGICYYLQGCRHIQIQPQELYEGKPVKAIWFDEPQLKIIKKSVVKPLNTEEPIYYPEAETKQPTGGPMLSTPTRQSNPKR